MAKPIVGRILQPPIRKSNSKCILWSGEVDFKGYGRLVISSGGKNHYFRPQRLIYEAVYGPIKKGLVLDHLCRTRLCINPTHLEAVTNKENIMRGVGLTAQNSKKTHCWKGHLLKGNNLNVNRFGQRRCKKCVALRQRKDYDPSKNRGKELATAIRSRGIK